MSQAQCIRSHCFSAAGSAAATLLSYADGDNEQMPETTGALSGDNGHDQGDVMKELLCVLGASDLYTEFFGNGKQFPMGVTPLVRDLSAKLFAGRVVLRCHY